MTERDDRDGAEPSMDDESQDDGVKDLVRNAFGSGERSEVDVLSGVQKKLRQRSGGKFYADGWSTARQPPVTTYLVTGLVMLAIVVITYLVLAPLSGEPKLIDTEPEPVQVLPPR